MIVVYFDGACEPVNPGGVGTYAFVVVKDGEVIYREAGVACEPGPDCTNNVAEYTGLLLALRWLKARGLRGAVVRGDSQLVVRQLTGQYAVRSERLRPLYEEAKELLRETSSTVEWVPREENSSADTLTKKAYIAYLDRRPEAVRLFAEHFADGELLAQLEARGIKPYKYISKIEAIRLLKNKKY